MMAVARENNIQRQWMERALALARQAIGRSSPNPPVGAVVVRDEVVVGEGWTQPAGGPHAEVVALQAAGSQARGADLYVTLEPCTFWGRTPPCTDAIIKAGIRHIYFAVHDPDRRMGAGAPSVLARAGIETTQLQADGAEELLAPFRYRTTKGRPLVIAKYAMTLDGKIATATGDSKWITGPAARRRVHELRDEVDAIMVGVGTVLADDPELTTRLPDHWRSVRHPLRVVVDSRGRTPLVARVLNPALPGHTLIATTSSTADWQTAVTKRGGEALTLPAGGGGRVDLAALLQALAARGCNSVLVEGGSTLLGSLLSQQLIDRIWAFIAPKLVGGEAAPGPIGGTGIQQMTQSIELKWLETTHIDHDLFVVAQPVWVEA